MYLSFVMHRTSNTASDVLIGSGELGAIEFMQVCLLTLHARPDWRELLRVQA